MSNDYINDLLANDKARYIRKLQCLHGTVGDTFDETMDPYCFSDRHWIDDIRTMAGSRLSSHIYVSD